MLKKYLPYIALIAAAFLLFYVKKNQRGAKKQTNIEQTEKRITVNPPSPAENQNRQEGLDRNYSNLVITKHARCRMDCRHIDETEIKEIIEQGKINVSKIEENARGKTYPLEGVTHDNQRVRIVVAPKPNGEMVVVTCIDLDREWSCDCK
jgi:acetylornithine deacetylase/succinyl-diaminopimelate desuccinylase-like protein